MSMHKSLLVSLICLASTLQLVACETSAKTIRLDLKSTHDGDLFYTELSTGRGSYQQTFNMLVSTSYHITWLPSVELSPTRGYRNWSAEHFDPERNSIRLTGSSYGPDYFHVHYGIWQVGSLTLPKQAFALAYSYREYKGMEPNIDGLLGLNDGVSEPGGVDYLFKSLYNLKHIDNFMYSLYINNTAVADRLNNNDGDNNNNNNSDDDWSLLIKQQNNHRQPVEGALVLGGIDSRYYNGDFRYVRMEEPTHEDSPTMSSELYSARHIHLSNITLTWSRVNGREELTDSIARLGKFSVDFKPSRLVLDSSLILFVGKKQVLETIFVGILGADATIKDNFYVFKDCRLDNKPDLVFTLMDGVDLTIKPDDYVIEAQLHNRKVCMSAFKPCTRDLWAFGTRFLRKYYTVFDYENNRVGFAEPT